MFNFIEIYSFIPASGWVEMGHCALLFPGVYNAVKTAMLTLLAQLYLRTGILLTCGKHMYDIILLRGEV